MRGTTAGLAALAFVAVGAACSSDDDEPTAAADAYPGISLEASVADDDVVLEVTAGDDEVVVLDPANPVVVDEGDDATRWVWERPPASGGDAGVQEDSLPGHLVAAGATVRLAGHPDVPLPEGSWEACTTLASPDETWEADGSDPSLRRVPPLADGSDGVELCAEVDEEGG